MPRLQSPDRSRRVLTYIKTFINEHAYPPSVREIQSGCNIASTSTVYDALMCLERDKLITRDVEKARGIRVTERTTAEIATVKTAVDVLGEQLLRVTGELADYQQVLTDMVEAADVLFHLAEHAWADGDWERGDKALIAAHKLIESKKAALDSKKEPV